VAEDHGQVRGEQLDPEREALRQLALAQIRQYPDPVLRMEARGVEQFDDELRRLVERMTKLMEQANGLGLAGTQVGVLSRVFIFHHGAEDRAIGVINPKLVERSEETEIDDEGCLSLQGVLVPVERCVRIRLSAQDPEGAALQLELEGMDARACQHELDHLDGILVLDRTTADARREAMRVLRPQPVLGELV
jgi:peptide deformylase